MNVKILNEFVKRFRDKDIDKSFYTLKQYKKLKEEGIANE